MKVIDLFSGIGGFSLGLEATGDFQTVAFCEQDKFCQAVLKKHWPGIPIHPDVKTFDFEGECDIITGGYPCQSFSVAGKRKGAADDRHLWPWMFEIVAQKRPSYVICENVAGHITMGLDQVLFDLESEGYTTRAFVIPACAVNAPHKRDRVWIIARKNVADTSSQRAGENNSGLRTRTGGVDRGEGTGGAEKPDNRSYRQHGWPQSDNGTTELCLGLPIDGLSRWLARDWERGVQRVTEKEEGRKMKLQALGNAVVPQIVEQIGLAIIAAERQ
jgi:DNA (cytosine-5)-methyltransferase 1